MVAERWCSEHSEPLLDLVCPYQHEWNYHLDGPPTPNFEAPEWLLVLDGIVFAVCDVDRIRWLRHPFDGGARRLAGRTEKGLGGRAWSIDMQQERAR